jgi:hypothetical protein
MASRALTARFQLTIRIERHRLLSGDHCGDRHLPFLGKRCRRQAGGDDRAPSPHGRQWI